MAGRTSPRIDGLPAEASRGEEPAGRASTPAEAYFERLEERFALAVTAAGSTVEREHEIAGARVVLRLAGAALAPVLLPALDHLAASVPRGGDFEVLAFDSASTGVAPPAAPADDTAGAGGVVRVMQRGARIFSMVHAGRARAVLWAADARHFDWSERAAPLRMVLQPWLASRGWQLVHGGAVGSAAAGALIVGRSGAGKSTLALSCLEAGLGYAGDDYVAATADPTPEAHSLYATAKLVATQLAHFPRLTASECNPGRQPGEKPVLQLTPSFAGQLVPRMRLRAVLLPRVTGTSAPRLRRISGAEALAAVAPSTLFQLPLDRAGALARLRRLVAGCPCWQLETGPRFAAGVDLVRALLGDLG